MTGTPVENRLEELWSQMHFTNPGLLGGRSDFRTRYAQPIAMGSLVWPSTFVRGSNPLFFVDSRLMWPRNSPPRTETVRRCTLSPEERNAYDSVRAATHAELVEKMTGGHGVMEALEAPSEVVASRLPHWFAAWTTC